MNVVGKIKAVIAERKANRGLITKLRAMAKHLDRVPDVNYGGCCVVAAEIAEHMQNKVPTRLRVAHLWNTGAHIDDARNNVSDVANGYEWHENGVYFGHVIVEFDYLGRTYHMDSSGVHQAKNVDPSFGYELYAGFLPLDDAKALAGQWANWNTRFDRSLIPRIKAIVQMHARTC